MFQLLNSMNQVNLLQSDVASQLNASLTFYSLPSENPVTPTSCTGHALFHCAKCPKLPTASVKTSCKKKQKTCTVLTCDSEL